jgi:hypothetical protein
VRRGLTVLGTIGAVALIWILPTQASSGPAPKPQAVEPAPGPGAFPQRVSAQRRQSGQTFLKRVGQAGYAPCNGDAGAASRVRSQRDWLKCRALLLPQAVEAPPGVKVRVIKPGQAIHWHAAQRHLK